MQAPITDEDRPAVEAMIKKLKRYRKRDTEHGKSVSVGLLNTAIANLMEYGAVKEWWKCED